MSILPAPRFIFGPVPSRRYGRSLGIDIVPMKTCTFNCTFCQLGPTPETTLIRKDWVPISSVLNELRTWLKTGESADILTLCGSGEPTLHLHFGDVLRFIHDETPYPSLLMSNGSLFTLPEVRRDATLADRVKISLHSWDTASFHAVTRPHPELSFDAIAESYAAFRQEYTGHLDVEVFIVPGINDSPETTDRILELLMRIRPDTVTVNTAERPPADGCVLPATMETLQRIRELFSTAAFPKSTEQKTTSSYSEEALLQLLRRHPMTIAQFSSHFDRPETEILTALRRIAQTEPLARRIPGVSEE